ncbi:MAG: metallophosphoesterase family protein [Caldilineaceae bacterium]
MRVAFLADIHGNLPALEAVIADLKVQAPDQVVLVGDQINRCPWTNEVLDLLAGFDWPTIYGNHEYIIARLGTPENFYPFTDPLRYPTLWWTHARLTPSHLAALHQLPAELTLTYPDLPSIYVTHGLPGNCYRGFLPEDSDDHIHQLLEHVEPSYIVSAHTHRPMDRSVPSGGTETSKILNGLHPQASKCRILNPGSVGLPYNGDVRAQYLLLDSQIGEWLPVFRQIDYDIDRLVKEFETSPMRQEVGPEVELHLRTALTGLPWSSDFSFWLYHQPSDLQRNLEIALPLYLHKHGPGHWAFA